MSRAADSGTTAEIAAGAARLVVEEGLSFGAAKHRAARDLGLPLRSSALPDNEAVEDEVRAYLDLFCADTQPAELQALRELAATWMERLAAFRPHLTGAVWRGTATRLSTVEIELYADDPKAVELALIDARVDYDVGETTGPRGKPVDALEVVVRSAALGGRVALVLAVLDYDDLRGALKPDARGRPRRGDLAAVRALEAAA